MNINDQTFVRKDRISSIRPNPVNSSELVFVVEGQILLSRLLSYDAQDALIIEAWLTHA